jgi:hypothetical protein
MDARIAHWPIDYAEAYQLAKDERSQLHFGTFSIPANTCDLFALHLLGHLNNVQQFKDAYFVHEFRGIKDVAPHNPFSDWERTIAFDTMKDAIHITDFDDGEWYIDVGIEFSMPGHMLQWSSTARRTILSMALPSLSAERIERLAGSNACLVDTSAHLYDFAGFRLPITAIRDRTDGVSYINVYTTDKSTTYQLHKKGIFRRRRAAEMIKNTGRAEILKTIDALYILYKKCGLIDADSDDDDDDLLTMEPNDIDRGIEGGARFEARIKADRAENAFQEFPIEWIRRTMFAIPILQWW